MHVRIYRITLIIVREIIVIKYRKLHFRARFSLPWHVSRKLDTNMCDFNIAFCDGENPFERGARTASKAFFRDPPFKRGSAPFKMHQYKIHSRGTRLIRCSYAHFPPLRWSILPPSRHTTANRSLAIPSNINISAPGYALLKSISREIDSAFFASFHRRDER